jgi:hypothetical protein
MVAHYTGVATSSALDQSSCNDATCATDTNSANRTDTNVTTTQAAEMLTACSYERDNHTFTAANSFNLRIAGTPDIQLADKAVSSTGSYPNGNWATVTGGSFNNYVSAFGTFKAAGASTNSNTPAKGFSF